MFRIRIYLDACLSSAPTVGYAALDWRRSKGLPDDSSIHWAPGAARLIECEVSEGFARQHFGPTENGPRRAVSPDVLCPGEMAVEPNTGGIGFGVLSDDRIRELWLAAGE